jgi:hypothetical protein
MLIVEEDTKGVIPFDVVEVDGIEGFKFDYELLRLYIIRLDKLEDAARDIDQPPVQLSITLDRADLSCNVTHVTVGINISNPCSTINPLSGLPIGVTREVDIRF